MLITGCLHSRLGNEQVLLRFMRGVGCWQIQSCVVVRLSKNAGYLIDNLYRAILSEMKESDQEEKGRATDCFPNWDTRNSGGWSGLFTRCRCSNPLGDVVLLAPLLGVVKAWASPPTW